MRKRTVKGLIAYILAIAMTISTFISPVWGSMVQAATMQEIKINSGSIDTSHGAGKFLVSISNAAELAENCSWYAGIYNGTNATSRYFAGQVKAGAMSLTTSIWVVGNAGKQGLIRFDVNATSDFSIPAGTVFTDVTDPNNQIIFNEEYKFDLTSKIVTAANMSIETIALDHHSWLNSSPGTLTWGVTIGNLAALKESESFKDVFTQSSVGACPTFKGNVQISTSSGTQTKTVEFRMVYIGEAWFYIGDAGITQTGTLTILKDTVFVSTSGGTSIKFPRTYTVDLANMRMTHEEEILELHSFSWTDNTSHVGVNVARQDEMKDVGWYAVKAGTNDNTYYQAYGNVVNEKGETKSIVINIANNGELHFLNSGVASKTITISKDTVFQSTGDNRPTKTKFTFKFASDYVIDIVNKKVISKEVLELDGYDWKDRSMYIGYNGNSSFNQQEWYEKNYKKDADREVINLTGIAKDHAGNDVDLTLQIRDGGKMILLYNKVQDTSITIPAGTVFKTSSVNTAQGNAVKKLYEFTFEKSHIVDPVNKYLGVAGAQWGEPGDANQDWTTNVADLIRMKKYLQSMGNSAETNISGWKLGFGADVNVDGSYDANDLEPLKTLLLTGNYATNILLVGNNTSIYSIVVPMLPTDEESFAAEELQYFLEEATGVQLPIIREIESIKGGRYLYVGDTTASDEASINPTYEEVKYNGFKIITDKQRIYIKGYAEYGTRNGVYQFLEDYFNYECYAGDEIGLTEKNRVEIADNYDKTVTPSFDWRHANYGELVYSNGRVSDTVLRKRMRYNSANEVFVTGYSYHNSFSYVRPDTWYANHPDWFYTKEGETSPTQLCYYKAANDSELFTVIYDNVRKEIKANNVPNLVFGIQDAYGWCSCDGCTASHNTYGADSAIVIQFINKLQEAINEWYAKEYPGKEPTKIVMFSYHDVQEPPIKTGDATKDALVTLHEDAGLFFAPSRASITKPYPEQESVSDIVDGWKEWTDNIYVWTYSLVMNNALLFIDNTDFMIPNYQYWTEKGAELIFDQTEHFQQYCNSGFSRLKMYMMSKLQWDCNKTEAEKNALIEQFFSNYFGEASTTMKALYDAERQQIKIIQQDDYSIGAELLQEQYWPKEKVVQYLDYIDQAYDDIAGLRITNPERYAQLYERILLESMQFRYIMLMLYPTYYGTNLNAQRTQFRTDFDTLKLTRYNEDPTEDEIIRGQLDYYLKEEIPVQIREGNLRLLSDGKNRALPVTNHNSLRENANSFYTTATAMTKFYGDVYVDGVRKTVRIDMPAGTSTGAILVLRETSFTTIEIPQGTEIRTKGEGMNGFYKIVFDKTYILNSVQMTITVK